MIPLVVASERGGAETGHTQWSDCLCVCGVARLLVDEDQIIPRVRNHARSRTVLERLAEDGESPVDETRMARAAVRKYHGTRETLWEAGSTTIQG